MFTVHQWKYLSTQNIYLHLILDLLRILGTPAEEDWPDNVTLLWSGFQKHSSKRLQDYVPEICNDGLDLLKVIAFIFTRKSYCIPMLYLYHILST
jgi:hypothetical protein